MLHLPSTLRTMSSTLPSFLPATTFASEDAVTSWALASGAAVAAGAAAVSVTEGVDLSSGAALPPSAPAGTGAATAASDRCGVASAFASPGCASAAAARAGAVPICRPVSFVGLSYFLRTCLSACSRSSTERFRPASDTILFSTFQAPFFQSQSNFLSASSQLLLFSMTFVEMNSTLPGVTRAQYSWQRDWAVLSVVSVRTPRPWSRRPTFP
mmetsp:Transcript_125323/g.313110  ORF Transcript_125323/g.313110 Transcript_125323/m.313110 type:complete len:212 (-) Transcript_125323:276-911(-)